jgi:hypothetical protein
MPLGLDLLLWLGPRFSMDRLVEPMLRQMGTVLSGGGFQPQDVQTQLDTLSQFFQEFNLLAMLRTFPIGVFSLMSGKPPGVTPLGNPAVLQVDSAGNLLGLVCGLTLAGWVLGGVYFRWVAALATPEAPEDAVVPAGRAALQTLLYSVICAALSWTIGLPVVFVLSILFSLNSFVGEGALLFLAFVSLWLIVPLFFSPHGIFIRKQNALVSFLGSFQITRFTLPASSLFVMTVVLLGLGLNLLWSVPTTDSWLALVGILGHAFITTALLASSFIYFHDMTAWVQTVLARLRANVPTPQA